MAKFLIALVLIGAGIYFYQQQQPSAAGSTIKDLLVQASSGPVSPDEARVTFTKAASELCAINGTDPANGFGTTEECLNQLHQETDQKCATQAIVTPSKPYSSEAELKSAFSTYMRCAGADLTQ